MNLNDLPEEHSYSMRVTRLEHDTSKKLGFKEIKIETYFGHSLVETIEAVGQSFGGGKYRVRAIDVMGQKLGTKTFEIAGIPKTPSPRQTNRNKA